MISFSGTSVALPTTSDLSVLGGLIELLRDPKKSAEAVAQLRAAAGANEKALAALQAERRDWDAAQTQAKQTTAKEIAAEREQIDRERAAWNAERAQAQAQIENWEKQAREALAKAEKDSKAAAALKRDREQRLARLHELAA
jgi:hypothetical protein